MYCVALTSSWFYHKWTALNMQEVHPLHLFEQLHLQWNTSVQFLNYKIPCKASGDERNYIWRKDTKVLDKISHQKQCGFPQKSVNSIFVFPVVIGKQTRYKRYKYGTSRCISFGSMYFGSFGNVSLWVENKFSRGNLWSLET